MRRSRYIRHRFPPAIISHAVWLYYRFSLSFREVEDLLAERGVNVTYETIRQWTIKFGTRYARRLKRRQGRVGDIWYLDEALHHDQRQASVSLARGGSRWRRNRYLGPTPSERTCGEEILSKALEESAPRTASHCNGQARKLPCRASRSDALGHPRDNPICEQSG